MTKSKSSVCYRILVILSLLAGVLMNVINTSSVSAILSYYTSQSNIICLITFACVIYMEFRKKDYKSSEMYYLIKGAITIAILITGITYLVALVPSGFQMDFQQERLVANKTISNLFVHVISPILVVLDYFLFDEKGHFKNYYPFIWLFIPFDYLLYVYTYGLSGGMFFNIGGSKKFAYFFLDYEKIGYIGVAKWLVLIVFCIILLSYLLVYFDKKMRDKNEPR